jgi:hypothetical protein
LLMAGQTSARTMPPWDAVGTDDCRPKLPWQHDISLSDAEISIIGDWAQGGAPEGDPSKAPPPLGTSTAGLSGANVELQPTTPFVATGQTDVFRCFVMDPNLVTDRYLNGTFVIPGNAAVVHHAVIFADPDRKSASIADSSGSYDCFGGPGIPNPQFLAVWTPGGVPFELPPTIGTPVKAGSLIVMQIHYHPHSTVAAADTTKVQLRFIDQKPQWYLAAIGIGNYPVQLPNGDGLQPGPDDVTSTPVFRIPANISGHTEAMQFTVPATVNGVPMPALWIYGVMAHMHLVGVDLKTQVVHTGSAGTECLLHEPAWRFDWQRFYNYDAPTEQLPLLAPGDKIRVTCTYDNTMSNPGVRRLLNDRQLSQPIDVYLGEQTTDEMCLAILPLVYHAY